MSESNHIHGMTQKLRRNKDSIKWTQKCCYMVYRAILSEINGLCCLRKELFNEGNKHTV